MRFKTKTVSYFRQVALERFLVLVDAVNLFGNRVLTVCFVAFCLKTAFHNLRKNTLDSCFVQFFKVKPVSTFASKLL